MIAKPGSCKTYKKFEAEIYVLTKDEGGRHTAFLSNYRPQFYLRTADITGRVELPDDVKMVMPGDNVTAVFELIMPVPLEIGQESFSHLPFCDSTILVSDLLTFFFLHYCETGQRFALREGGRTVGAGVVSKVMT